MKKAWKQSGSVDEKLLEQDRMTEAQKVGVVWMFWP